MVSLCKPFQCKDSRKAVVSFLHLFGMDAFYLGQAWIQLPYFLCIGIAANLTSIKAFPFLCGRRLLGYCNRILVAGTAYFHLHLDTGNLFVILRILGRIFHEIRKRPFCR